MYNNAYMNLIEVARYTLIHARAIESNSAQNGGVFTPWRLTTNCQLVWRKAL